MYRHLRPFLFLCASLLAFGCSTDLNTGSGVSSNSSPYAANTALFDPTTSTVPLPNILATATAKDPLSQYVDASGAVKARPAGKAMTPPEALAYVNIYEMGNTNAVSGLNSPIYIRFASPVDPVSLTPSTVKVFELTADAAGTENAPLGLSDITGLFTFQYKSGGTDLFLFPNFPLKPGTRYLYLVTNRVKDAASGNPVSASFHFDLLKTTTPLTGGFSGLEAIRANVMSGSDIKLSGYGKVMDDLVASSGTSGVSSRAEIALIGRFITTGAGFIQTDATNPASRIPMESALRSFAAGAALGGLPGKTWTNTVSVTTPAGLTPAAYWTSVTGSTATLPATVASVATGTFNSAELAIDPVVAKANTSTSDLTGITLNGFPAYSQTAGVLQAFRTGANLTGFYHKASSVPFVFLKSTTPNGKLVIFQHGIIGQKEQVVAVAGALTAAGYAVVAIDLPLHGDLKIAGHTTGDLWGQDFMAVGAPLTTRSNVQQAAFNLHRLELTVRTGGFAALGIVPPAPPAGVDIKYVGISLGSIVGAYYLAGNTTLSTTGYPYTQATLDKDMKGFLSVPGARLAYLLKDSPSFNLSVNSGLATKGVDVGTPSYNQFFLVTQSIVDPVDPASLTTPLATGLPSRLSGRLAVQEAIGDLVIPNDNTRYFGTALGGREILGALGAAVAPGFKQLGYRGAAAARIPSSFMYTLTGGAPTPKVDFAAAQSNLTATTPAEGYFQFDQAGINHGFLIDPRASVTNTTYAQTQMVNFLLRGVIVDPTPTGVAKPVSAVQIPELNYDVRLPAVLNILGY